MGKGNHLICFFSGFRCDNCLFLVSLTIGCEGTGLWTGHPLRRSVAGGGPIAKYVGPI